MPRKTKTPEEIQNIAARHGLQLTQDMQFNDMGIDFQVGFATDTSGQEWLLRLPRRNDMERQIGEEKRILELVKKHLSVQVPDWKISAIDLVAYPLLDNKPVLTFDAQTYEVSWNMEKDSPEYVPSLAGALVEIHAIPASEVKQSKLKVIAPGDLRAETARHLAIVKSEIGISPALEKRYQRWLDNDKLWPGFTRFVHGDLYAGHVLASENGKVSGIIDWSTAHVGDPAVDFSGHASVFGEASLKQLIGSYEEQGGRVWDTLYEQSLERAAAAPLAYGFFAAETQDPRHIDGAKAQLGVS